MAFRESKTTRSSKASTRARSSAGAKSWLAHECTQRTVLVCVDGEHVRDDGAEAKRLEQRHDGCDLHARGGDGNDSDGVDHTRARGRER